jgi:hypothetical protein
MGWEQQGARRRHGRILPAAAGGPPGRVFRHIEVAVIGTIASPAATRSRSSLVFWALVALVISIAVAGQLLGQGSLRPQALEAGALPLVEEAMGTLPTDWSVDADEAKAGGPGFPTPPGESVEAPLRDDLFVADAVEAEDGAAPTADRPVDDALIVRTGSLELEIEDVAAALAAARREITQLGGYVAGSDEYDQGESRWASVTYRVPVERFSEAIVTLRALSDRVVHESTQSAEVTATVVDLGARISNLRASEQALVEIMDRAGRIDDVLSVQLRLEDVRGRIEQLEAQRANLADQAALSTLTVSWYTPVAAVSVVQEGWDVATEADRALAQTVEALQGLASLAIWFGVVVLPLVILPVLLVLGALFVLRRRRVHPATATE